MSKFFKFLVIPALLFACMACEEENLSKNENGSDNPNIISFHVGNDEVITKSVSGDSDGTVVATYDLDAEEDGGGIVLVETVSSASAECYETKGTPVYTENFDSLYEKKLYGTAYDPSGTYDSPWASALGNGTGAVQFKKTSDHTYSFDYSDQSATGLDWNVHWPESGKLVYFLQAPYDVTSKLSPEFSAGGVIEFDYTDPTEPEDVSGTKTIVNGAAKQTDLLFTSKEVSKPESGFDNKHNILMYHALTAIKFKVVDPDAAVEQAQKAKTEITKVTFKGIKANGHCTITPAYTDANTTAGENASNKTGAAASKSAECSVWGAHSEDDELRVDYSQAFSDTVNYSKTNSDFADSFYDGSNNLSNLGATHNGSEILLLVPQVLEDVVLEVEYTINDKPFKRSVKLNTTWLPGEIHTYTLTINHVSVSISDQMNAPYLNEKTGVTTKNDGNVTAYLRATYALAWYYGYDEDATCVAAYQGNGIFRNLGGPNENDGWNKTWILGSDGYYYYTWPVKPGNSTGFSLFEKYIAPEKSEKGPFPGAHLEMKLLLQGVQYDLEMKNVTKAWGDVYTVDSEGKPTTTKIVDVLSKDVENVNL